MKIVRTCKEVTLARAVPTDYDIVFRREGVYFCLVSVCSGRWVRGEARRQLGDEQDLKPWTVRVLMYISSKRV